MYVCMYVAEMTCKKYFKSQVNIMDTKSTYIY